MTTLIILALLGIAALFTGVFGLRKVSIPIVVAGLIVALYFNISDWNVPTAYYNNMLFYDNFSVAFTSIMIVSTILLFLLCSHYYRNADKNITDIYGLMIFTLTGGVILVSYSNMAMLFLGIEILSIPLYILAGSNRNSISGNESSMKYFLMGSFASGILLFGIALLYMGTQSFDLEVIQSRLTLRSPLTTVGILMILAGFLFKVSAVPFHFWAPDVYQGAPTVITAFMATVVKTAGFAAFLRMFEGTFHAAEGVWFNILWVVTALTLIVANITALYQKGLKRLLAYSSVSHAGYLLLGVLVLDQTSPNTLLYYAAAYSVSTLAAFGVLLAVKEQTGTDEIYSFAGLGKKNPFLAFALTVSFLSLAGIPPLAGFFAKYFMLTSALNVNLFWIVMIALVNSAIGAYYYLKVVSSLYFKEAEGPAKVQVSVIYNLVIIIALAITLAIGIMPEFLMNLINSI